MYIHINRENLVGSEITNKDHLISAGQGFGCLLKKVVMDTVGRYSDHIVNKGTCLLYFNKFLLFSRSCINFMPLFCSQMLC